MSVRIACPGCKQPLECRPDHAGQAIACPMCGQRMRVPAAPAASPPPSVVEATRPRLNTSGDDNPFSSLSEDEGEVVRTGTPRLKPRLPASVRDLLGEPIREFKTAGQAWILLVGICVFSLGVLLTVFSFSAAAGRHAPTAAVAFVLVGLAGIGVGVARMGRRVIVCEDGFVHCTAFGSRPIRWEEVQAIHEAHVRIIVNGRHFRTVHEYAVRMRDLSSIVFDQRFEGIQLLGRRLQDGVTKANWARALEDFHAGEWIEFGAVRVSRWGLGFNRDELPWAEVEELAAEKGELVVFRRFAKGAWAVCGLASIPNLGLFTKLLAFASGNAP